MSFFRSSKVILPKVPGIPFFNRNYRKRCQYIVKGYLGFLIGIFTELCPTEKDGIFTGDKTPEILEDEIKVFANRVTSKIADQ